MDQKELYSEKLMNLILDAIEEVIVIHDADHNILWMNHAGEKAFAISVDKALSMKCHQLFKNSIPCSDCDVSPVVIGEPTNSIRKKVIPSTGTMVECRTIPYYRDGKIELVIQCLRPLKKCEE
jgi:PAS domain-containing protein